MSQLKNIFAFIGVVSVLLTGLLSVKIFPVISQLADFDSHAVKLYFDVAKRALEERSGVEAMVIKVPVKSGVSAGDVDDSIKIIASELNIKNVGELPMYKEVQALSGVPFRYAKIYLLCDAMIAASLLNHSDGFSSYLPCRISVVEDPDGQLWLYTLDMDIMIYGGRPLPPALKEDAIKVRDTIIEIMNRAAVGDF
ncbi:MAG: DUF302 domain-containing protein [Gammaproteobacteria bacterium]|nr:DUF302 domain-containing protein [Gammaproteobacteria bacterium]